MFSILMIVWGIWMVAPWHNIAFTPSLYLLIYFLPKWVWGVIAIVLGVLQLLWVRTGSKGLVFTIMLQFYFWAFVAACVGLVGWHSTDLVIYAWLALMTGLGWVNNRVKVE